MRPLPPVYWSCLWLFYLVLLVSCESESPNTPKELFNEHFEAIELEAIEKQVHFVSRKGIELSLKQKKASWVEAVKPYRAGRHEQSVRAFLDYLKKYPNSQKVRLFLASSFLALNRVEEAVPHLDTLLKEPDGLYFEYSQWLRALAHLHQGDLQATKDALHQIIRLDWHYYHEEAEKLLPHVEAL